MKRKNLIKKIRSLETRLQKGAKKLAKLKGKLTAAGVGKAKKKSGSEARETRQGVKVSPQSGKRKDRSKVKASGQPAQAKRRRAARKVKRKLNLSPERRAQLAAAMKARWAAKRAAEGNPQGTDRDFTLGQTPQSS
jgi:hypothetical protein